VVDFGSGDGRFVTAAAAAAPDTLVVGVDASTAGLGAGYERARRRGLTNTLFVVAAAEAPPSEMWAVADELVVQFPWGSLLHALLTPGDTARGLTELLAPGGRFLLSLSVSPHDRVAGVLNLDAGGAEELAGRLAGACGLEARGVETLSWADVQASGSSWAKRLGVGRSRSGFKLTLSKP
jgi:16S rRNA (adenine(1408)-N(1))-methyltransferase